MRYHVYVFLPAVFVYCIGGIDYIQENVIPKSLEGRNREGYRR